jgi:protocatechuate 3,4-dioxygenase beta subunit
MANDNATSNNVALQSMDLTVDNITKNTKLVNSQTPNPRLKFLMEKLVDHLHDYVRETRLTTEEWTETIKFLTGCGQMCSNIRQEFILLSDILGVSVLVDAVNNPKPPNATESTVLGPFYTDDAQDVANGDSIASSGKGEVCLVLATIKDTKGKPIEGARINVWETDGNGLYDNQYEERDGPDMRGRLTSDQHGEFYFKCVKPVSYPVPVDGPVGKLLGKLHRHAYRPAHIHFRINVPGNIYDDLVTALYVRGDPYESSDAVFGVKKSLIVDVGKVEDASIAKKYDVNEQDWLIKYDFVLTKLDETQTLLSVPSQN